MNKKRGNSVGAHNPQRPNVYRPQPVPKVLQTKKPIGPSAPPVYRPQPAPKVLQTKMGAGIQSATRPTPTTNRSFSPPVYQLPLPKVLQAKSARPQSLAQSLHAPPKPAPPSRTQVPATRSTSVVQRASVTKNSATAPARSAQPAARSTVIQRVTYKGVLYDPASEDAQTNFLAEAKRDMVAAGMWAQGRSENIVKAIGKTTKTIIDAGALRIEERSLWKDYDVAIDTDLQALVAIQRDMDTQVTLLEGLIPRLKAEDVSAQVNAAVAEIKRVFDTCPKKWNLKKYGVDSFEKTAINKLVKLQPWTLAARIRIAEEDLAAAQSPDPSAPPQPASAAAAARPIRSAKKVAKELADLRGASASVAGLERQALTSVAEMRLVTQSIGNDIRESAASHYTKGLTGYESAKSRMRTKKFYLGEIATTEPLTRRGNKGRGVLWARPWSPGVNTAFLQGGVEAGAVYKLKTAVPDNIKQHLVGGDSAAFKAAVTNQASDPYRPFWHGVDRRFTIYTDELSYLAGKGYKLHEFRRKDGTMQQLMIHPSQLAAVTAAYDGR